MLRASASSYRRLAVPSRAIIPVGFCTQFTHLSAAGMAPLWITCVVVLSIEKSRSLLSPLPSNIIVTKQPCSHFSSLGLSRLMCALVRHQGGSLSTSIWLRAIGTAVEEEQVQNLPQNLPLPSLIFIVDVVSVPFQHFAFMGLFRQQLLSLKSSNKITSKQRRLFALIAPLRKSPSAMRVSQRSNSSALLNHTNNSCK